MPSWLTVGASWMSRPTPWPVPCSKRSAQPASAMIWRQTSSTSLALIAGPHGGGPGRLGLAHHGEDARQLALGVRADAEGARHVGAVALEGGAEVDHHRVAGVDACGPPGWWWGLAEFSPGGDDRLEGGALRPSAAHGGVELEGEVLLGDALGSCSGSTSNSAASAMAAARSMRAISAASLRSRSASTALEVATSRSASSSPAQVRCALQLTLSASRPMRPTWPGAERGLGGRALLGHRRRSRCRRARRHRPARPARRTGCGSARRWSSRAASRDGQDARRAREPGQVADVGQRGHDQGVDLVGVERRRAAVETARHGDRRQRRGSPAHTGCARGDVRRAVLVLMAVRLPSVVRRRPRRPARSRGRRSRR